MTSERELEGEKPRGYHEWTVGDRLRAARESITGDRKKFAEMIAISPDTIRAYERGESRPKAYIVAAWCLATGFDKDWILTGEKPSDDPNDGGVPGNVTLRERRLFPRDNPRSLKVAA